MSIFERIAELPLWWVAVIVVLLWLGRWILRKRTGAIAKQLAGFCESLAIAGALVFFIIRPFIVQTFFIPSESMVPTLKVNDRIMVNRFIYRVTEPKRGDVIVFKAPAAATPDGRRKNFVKRVIAVPGDAVSIVPGRVIVDGSPMGHQAIGSDFTDMGEQSAVKFASDAVTIDGRRVGKTELAARLGVDPKSVRVVPGKVSVNGKVIREPYIAEDPDMEYPILHGPMATPKRWVRQSPEGGYYVKIPRGRLLVMGDNRNRSFDSRFWGLLDRREVMGKAMFSFWPLGRIGIVR